MLKSLENIEQFEETFKNQINEQIIIDYRVSLKTDMRLEIFILVANNKKDYDKTWLQSNKISVKIITESEKNYDPMYGYIFSDKYLGENAKIDLGLTWRFDSLLNINTEKEENHPKNPCNVVTFYSYKGGMGRTTTLCAYAIYLASEGKKVVILDCDFEAPGFLSFFDIEDKQRNKGGLVEYMMDKDFLGKENLNLKENYLIEVEKTHYQSESGKIYVLPAGNLSYEEVAYTPNEQQQKEHLDRHLYHYIHGLARLNVANTVDMVAKFRDLFADLKTGLELSEDDYILIDSRTGFNEIFGITAFNLANVIVSFFGSSEQTRAGLYFLLDKYQDIRPQPKLMLVNSIVPNDEETAKDFLDSFKTLTQEYKDKKESEWDILGNIPIVSLRENKVLKQAGVKFFDKEGKEIKAQENELLKLVKTGKFTDYDKKEKIFEGFKDIFDRISNFFVKEAEVLDIDKLSVKELRDVVLKHLAQLLQQNDDGSVKIFAEDGEIEPQTFFYRECMKSLFLKEKFIIKGFKGSGKTYLYKALTKEETQKIILRKSNIQELETYKFVDVIETKGNNENTKNMPFDNESISDIKNFNDFWQVYMWSSIMLDNSIQNVVEEFRINYPNEQLETHTQELKNTEGIKGRKIIFLEYIKNDTNAFLIEKDLNNLNNFLKNKGIKLFVLFDQLDKIAKTNDWSKLITPLVEFWRDNYNKKMYSNIYPKIFIRTDIVSYIATNNVESIKNTNIISIEWENKEVYLYFFNLLFSSEESAKAFLSIMRKYGEYEETIITSLEKIIFEKKIDLFDKKQIDILLNTFFGKEIKTYRGVNLGTPFDFFFLNFSNANQENISLRPFINIMSGTIQKGLRNELPTSIDIEGIEDKESPYEYYPQYKNNPPIVPVLHYVYVTDPGERVKATQEHFNDLTKETGNNWLQNIIECIQNLKKAKSEVLQGLRKVVLTEEEMEMLLDEVLKNIGNDSKDKPNTKILSNLLEINGIAYHDKKNKIYRFAQMYKYWLGLKSKKNYGNEKLNSNVSVNKKNRLSISEKEIGQKKSGKIKKVSNKGYGFIFFNEEFNELYFHSASLTNISFNDLTEGDEVEFIIGKDKNGKFEAKQIKKIS